MPLFRPLSTPVLPALLGCAVALAGCQSGPKAAGSAGGSRTASPVADCLPKAEIVKAISEADDSTGAVVSGPIVCDGEWAAAQMNYPGLDPARVVVRRQKNRLEVVTVGTDRLCDIPEMRPAPEAIRKSLGELC